MPETITVSAPGKLMLFGEHAVLAGYPCIVTAVSRRIRITITLTHESDFILNALDVGIIQYQKPVLLLGKGAIPKQAKFTEIAVKTMLDYIREHEVSYPSIVGLTVTSSSDFSSEFGFGSSAAVTVCIVYALSELFNLRLSKKELFSLAYEAVCRVQGKGSGFDVAASVYGDILYFVAGGKEIEPLAVAALPLIVGFSGKKADTVTVMNEVAGRFENNKKKQHAIYLQTARIVKMAKQSLLEGNYHLLGQLMNENQQQLVKLGVSTPKLDAMISAANGSGAYGAKLSGAGGGDCMIALSAKDKKRSVEDAVAHTGGTILSVTTQAKGVKTER